MPALIPFSFRPSVASWTDITDRLATGILHGLVYIQIVTQKVRSKIDSLVRLSLELCSCQWFACFCAIVGEFTWGIWVPKSDMYLKSTRSDHLALARHSPRVLAVLTDSESLRLEPCENSAQFTMMGRLCGRRPCARPSTELD
jgi:hypothetical protein